jgi:hypothetical protein
LLAPRASVAAAISGLRMAAHVRSSAAQIQAVLRSQFGLPEGVARSYAKWLAHKSMPQMPIRQWLGVDSGSEVVELPVGDGNSGSTTEENP